MIKFINKNNNEIDIISGSEEQFKIRIFTKKIEHYYLMY